MIMVMDEKKPKEIQNTASETETVAAVDKTPKTPPVISDLYKIEDVENEQTDTSKVKFQDAEPIKPRSYVWLSNLFIVLALIQVAAIVVFFQMMDSLVRDAELGATGVDASILIVFVIFIPAVVVTALVNLVGLPIYLVRKKPNAKIWALGAISILLSLVVFAFGVQVYLLNAVS